LGNRLLLILMAVLFIGCGSSSSVNGDVKGKIVEINSTLEEMDEGQEEMDEGQEEMDEGQEEIIRLKGMLNDDSIPYTTEVDFNKSLYGEGHLESEQARQLAEEHRLVATATDPDSEWFITNVDKQVVLMQAGESYTVNLNKERRDGTIIGPVDNDKLRLVVTVQRSKDNFETLDSNVGQYAEWVDAGTLKIELPNDLNQGRLVVAVRPNFNEASTNAIAERWSTVMVAEVWETQDNVVSLDGSDVLFPMDATESLAVNSEFDKEEIGEVVKKELEEKNQLLFPMVVKDQNLKEGDLISYLFRGIPYSGRVYSVMNRENQQFITMVPELFKVYHITEAEDGFMINQGLFPKQVIFREGEAFDENMTVSTTNEIMQKSEKSQALAFFSEQCSIGGSVLTFSPQFSLYPLDASIDVALYSSSNKVECKWESTPNRFKHNLLLPFAGPFTIVSKLFGAGGEITPYGVSTIATEGVPGLGLKATYSIRDKKKRDIKILSIIDIFNVGNRSIDATARAFTGKAEITGSLGLKLTLNAISPDGVISWVFEQLSISLGEIGVVSKAGVKASLVATLNNAKEVYDTKKSSNLALNVDVEGSIEATNSLLTLAKDWGVELKAVATKQNLITLKAEAKHKFFSLLDNGAGKASLSFVSLESDYLSSFFLDNSLAILAPNDTQSSVFNDYAESITYATSECAKDSEYKIEAPAIACSGWLCGDVNRKVKLCQGQCKEPSRYTVESHQNRGTKDWRVTVKDTENHITHENVYPFNLEGSLYFLPTGERVLASCGGESIRDSWENQQEGEFWIIDNNEKEKIKIEDKNTTATLAFYYVYNCAGEIAGLKFKVYTTKNGESKLIYTEDYTGFGVKNREPDNSWILKDTNIFLDSNLYGTLGNTQVGGWYGKIFHEIDNKDDLEYLLDNSWSPEFYRYIKVNRNGGGSSGIGSGGYSIFGGGGDTCSLPIITYQVQTARMPAISIDQTIIDKVLKEF